MSPFTQAFGCCAALFTSLGFLPSAVAATQPITIRTLTGAWSLNKDKLPREEFEKQMKADGYYTFTFWRNGIVEAETYWPNGRAPGVGEGFGAQGKFQIQGGKLIFKTEPSDAWPSTHYPQLTRYVCSIQVADDGKSFELADCDFEGRWMRSSEQPQSAPPKRTNAQKIFVPPTQ